MKLVGGGADTKIWFRNYFLIMSIKTAEANPWAKEKKVGILGPRRKRRERDKVFYVQALERGRQAM